MSKHEKNRSSPKEFTENSFEGKISDPQTIKTIAYKFNEYLVNVGPHIGNKTPQR